MSEYGQKKVKYWYSTCSSKIGFNSEEEAHRCDAAKKVYHCPYCLKWHLASVKEDGEEVTNHLLKRKNAVKKAIKNQQLKGRLKK